MGMFTTLHLPSRVDHVRETYHEELALYLLSGDAFRIDYAHTPSPAMAEMWHGIFDDLTRKGYMRRSQTGRYYWQHYAVSVTPAGPGRLDWHVHDTTKDTAGNIVKSGHVSFPADSGQDEINAAGSEAETAARQAMAELGR